MGSVATELTKLTYSSDLAGDLKLKSYEKLLQNVPPAPQEDQLDVGGEGYSTPNFSDSSQNHISFKEFESQITKPNNLKKSSFDKSVLFVKLDRLKVD